MSCIKGLWVLAVLFTAIPAFGYNPLDTLSVSPTYALVHGQLRLVSSVPLTDAPHKMVSMFPEYRGMPTSSTQGACLTLRFTVNKQAHTQNVGVWAYYPSFSKPFAQAAKRALHFWIFFPRKDHGRLVATSNVLQEFVYVRHHASEETDAIARADLGWICRQPPMHGVAIIVGRGIPSATAAGVTVTHGVGAWRYGPLTTVTLPRGVLPAGALPGRVRVRFCVDTRGRATDTVILSDTSNTAYFEAARRALEAVHFSARQFKRAWILTCGEAVTITFSGRITGYVGKIGTLQFKTLSKRSPEPRLKEAIPAKISLHIPTETSLPPVAHAVVRLCIDKDGTVSQSEVVQADPPRLFNQAALATVRGWRFAKLTHRMCDVYEGVQFPLSSGGK